MSVSWTWRCAHCGKDGTGTGDNLPAGWTRQNYHSRRASLKGTPAEHAYALGCSPEHARLAALKYGDLEP